MKKTIIIGLLSLVGWLEKAQSQTFNNSYVIRYEYDAAGNRIVRRKVASILSQSVVQPTGANEYRLYPNPTSSYLNLDLDAIEQGEGRLDILDAQGRVVIEQPFRLEKGKQQQTLELYNLPTGIYFVRLQLNKNRPITEKLIITEE